MNVSDVQKRLEDIANEADDGDNEAAHSMEDDLYFAVLKAIAEGKTDDPQSLAREALKSADIEFTRWCA